MTHEPRAFVDGLLRRIPKPPPDAHAAFRDHVMARWKDIELRVEGSLVYAWRDLPEVAWRCLRALEDTRGLLAPLGRGEDERTHTRVLAWALGRRTDLGARLRAAFAGLVGVDLPAGDWHVRAESSVAPRCRVDVDLQLPGRWRCFVEAKVRADERPSQLADYRRALDALPPGLATTLVFLTVHPTAPQHDVRCEPLTWGRLVAAWLPHVLGPEPDAAWLRAWLVGIADDLYEARADGPFTTWDVATRVRALDLLRQIPTEAP